MLNNLIARQSANIAAFEALMVQRKTEAPTAPRSAFAQEKGWKNIAMQARDKSLRTKPIRQIVLNERDYEVFVWSDGGKVIERFNLREAGAAERFDRYQFV